MLGLAEGVRHFRQYRRGRGSDRFCSARHVRACRLGQRRQARYVRARHDQQMAGGQRPDVQERNYHVIGLHLAGRQPPCDDRAEQALRVSHGAIIPARAKEL